MLYVIKTENNDVIVFDSVTSFSESNQGSVTSHPVEDGSKISDHMLVENKRFRIAGVVSDYNFFNPLKSFANEKVPAYKYDRQASLNTLNVNNTLNAKTPVPGSYYGTDTEGAFSVKTSAADVKATLLGIHTGKKFFTLLEYDTDSDKTVINSYTNCVITDITFDLSGDSGYAIYPNMSIEQVKVVPVKVVSAKSDKIIVKKVADGAATDKNGGNKAGTSTSDGVTWKQDTKAEQHIAEMENLRSISATRDELSAQLTAWKKANEALNK